jgi:hypothetical protein
MLASVPTIASQTGSDRRLGRWTDAKLGPGPPNVLPVAFPIVILTYVLLDNIELVLNRVDFKFQYLTIVDKIAKLFASRIQYHVRGALLNQVFREKLL